MTDEPAWVKAQREHRWTVKPGTEAEQELLRQAPGHRVLYLHGPQPGELVGPAEVAEMCNVKPTTVYQWVNRGRLPEPWDVVSGTRLWTKTDVRHPPAFDQTADTLARPAPRALLVPELDTSRRRPGGRSRVRAGTVRRGWTPRKCRLGHEAPQ